MNVMAKYLTNLPELFNTYKRWVASNPQLVGDVETTVKWMSYLVAGRITSSAAMSELIYTLSSLLVLFNDQIIEKSQNKTITVQTNKNEDSLKLFLTTLEYCEVFIEYSGRMVYGEKGRWCFIVLVQLVKFIGRLMLKLFFKNAFVQNPPLQPLDRKKIAKSNSANADGTEQFQSSGNFTFTLKRSGRVVRKVEGAPPVYMRNWKPLTEHNEVITGSLIVPENNKNEIAEYLYICKPLIHLGVLHKFGLKSWRSWGTAIIIDLLSLRLYYKNRQNLTKEHRVELSRRCVAMLLYLLRSPFYESFTGDKIEALINSVSKNIPLTKAICGALNSYIPHWQETYFYMWST